MFSDPYAVEKFKELVRDYGVKTVVETGTYKGDSTVRIAELVPRTVSVELFWDYFVETRNRFLQSDYSPELTPAMGISRFSKAGHIVELYWGNSPEVIKSIINQVEEPILFFLDAHWRNYWPLRDEIKAIQPRPNSLIIIHDFKVPGKDFGYDTYIPGTAIATVTDMGQVLDYEYVKDELAGVNPDYQISYNERAAGSYRGILYAVPPKGVQA